MLTSWNLGFAVQAVGFRVEGEPPRRECQTDGPTLPK